jgi:hypothetical protein
LLLSKPVSYHQSSLHDWKVKCFNFLTLNIEETNFTNVLPYPLMVHQRIFLRV